MTDPLSEPDALRAAAETMRQVRERCVWSQRITHRDLVPYLIEEAHELIDAVERDDRAEMREELGDLLWQVLFHAAITAQSTSEPFDIDDVARGLTEKMVRRHPHVFADAVATTPEEVLVHWNAAKAAEKRERRSVLDGVPAGMPALARAQKVLGRAAHVAPAPASSWVPAACPEPAEEPAEGSVPPWVPEPVEGPVEGPVPSWVPELAEGPATSWVPEPAEGPAPSWVPEPAEGPAEGPASEAELGDALLALVAVAREHGWDAERALRERIRRLEDEVRAAESDA